MIRLKRLLLMTAFSLTSFMIFFHLNAISSQASSTGTVYVTGTQDYSASAQILKYINKQRSKNKLSAVKLDNNLTNAAIQRAAELTMYIPTTSPHKRPNGLRTNSINKKINYEICLESYGYISESEVVSHWMNSSVHKKGILLRNAKSVGISCFSIGETCYWCAEFSSSPIKSKVTAKNEKTVTKKVSVLNKYIGSS